MNPLDTTAMPTDNRFLAGLFTPLQKRSRAFDFPFTGRLSAGATAAYTEAGSAGCVASFAAPPQPTTPEPMDSVDWKGVGLGPLKCTKELKQAASLANVTCISIGDGAGCLV